MSDRAAGPRVAILGAGRFARAVARILGQVGARASVWARSEASAAAIIEAADAVEVCTDIGDATKRADVVVFAVPASAIEAVAGLYGPFARGDQIVIHAARGVASGFALPHQLIRSKTCVRKIGALGGPLQAGELGSGRPLAAVLGSRFDEAVDAIRALTRSAPVSVHGSRDIIGVEVAGAVSNVSALAAGMANAIDFGDTARGILLTHGLVEAQRIGCALGADAATFTGLAGVGDLIPRHVSSTDRHLEVGALVARGASLEAALERTPGHVEGVLTAFEADALAKRKNLSVPLVSAVASVLRGQASPEPALERVLRLDDLELGRALG